MPNHVGVSCQRMACRLAGYKVRSRFGGRCPRVVVVACWSRLASIIGQAFGYYIQRNVLDSVVLAIRVFKWRPTFSGEEGLEFHWFFPGRRV